jgi:hypothetical protein
MKPEDLKLYNKYRDIREPNIEYIYIGIDNTNNYCFLFKSENCATRQSTLKRLGFNIDKIIKNLNLETFINFNHVRYIEKYDWATFKKNEINFFKPHLKDKLYNILNR